MAGSRGASRLRSLHFEAGAIRVSVREKPIDRLAWSFCARLNRLRVRYAVVSGYPAILLGRDRESEDVDILSDPLKQPEFLRLHHRLLEEFECLSPGEGRSLYRDYLAAGPESTSVRYSTRKAFVPNVEFKFAKTALHEHSIRQRKRVLANGHLLYIGPLEVQIAYKIWLGTPKDLEDARWIFRVAAGNLDEAEVWRAARKLGIPKGEGGRALGVD